MNLSDKLASLNLVLPSASTPGGNYNSVNIRANVAYVAIQFPIVDGKYFYQGRLGAEISTEDGYKAMQICALNVISQIESKLGFGKIEGLNHLDAYYQGTENWDEAPIVVNGASDLFTDVLGKKGIHSRSILGVHTLPRNFCVGITCSFTLSG